MDSTCATIYEEVNSEVLIKNLEFLTAYGYKINKLIAEKRSIEKKLFDLRKLSKMGDIRNPLALFIQFITKFSITLKHFARFYRDSSNFSEFISLLPIFSNSRPSIQMNTDFTFIENDCFEEVLTKAIPLLQNVTSLLVSGLALNNINRFFNIFPLENLESLDVNSLGENGDWLRLPTLVNLQHLSIDYLNKTHFSVFEHFLLAHPNIKSLRFKTNSSFDQYFEAIARHAPNIEHIGYICGEIYVKRDDKLSTNYPVARKLWGFV